MRKVSKTDLLIWWLTNKMGYVEVDNFNGREGYRAFRNPDVHSTYLVNKYGDLRKGSKHGIGTYALYLDRDVLMETPGARPVEFGSFSVTLDWCALQELYDEVYKPQMKHEDLINSFSESEKLVLLAFEGMTSEDDALTPSEIHARIEYSEIDTDMIREALNRFFYDDDLLQSIRDGYSLSLTTTGFEVLRELTAIRDRDEAEDDAS